MGKRTNIREAIEGEVERGREAFHPHEIPPRGWWDIALRIWEEIGHDNVALVAAGIAFYALLALFPGITAVAAIYGLVVDAGDIREQLNALEGLVSPAALELVGDQLASLNAGKESTLGVAFVVGLTLALWSARKGMSALFAACNIAYEEVETRGFFKLTALTLAFTLGAVIAAVLVLTAAFLIPLVLEWMHLPELVSRLLSWLRWPLLALLSMVALAVIYRYAPDRSRPRWAWVSWGAAIATFLWLLASIGFTAYVEQTKSIEETYGALGGIIVVLLWFYITGYAIVLGAEVNAEMEHQTRADTTTGAAVPMGERGAFVADTLGRSAQERKKKSE
ncbi:YihY/virulence factor BrkB family protein [soil metagenome]